MTRIMLTLFEFFKNLRNNWISSTISLGVAGVTCYIGTLVVSHIGATPI